MKNYIICILLILLCGCSEKHDAEEAVKLQLKDPDSAKFGNFTKVNEVGGCLTVNSRNSMGGYVGDQQAIVFKEKNIWTVMDIQPISQGECIAFINNLTNSTVIDLELKKACDEIKSIGGNMWNSAQDMCSNAQYLPIQAKTEIVSSWNKVKQTLEKKKLLDDEARKRGYID